MRTMFVAAFAASTCVLACTEVDPSATAPVPAVAGDSQAEPAAQAPLATALLPAPQDETAPPAADQPQQPQQPPQVDPAADAAAKEREADRLIAAFGNLLTAAQSLGGLGETDLMMVERLRADLELFNLRWPEDQRMLALELQCSRWLGDRDRVDQLFYQLVELNPHTPAMVITWADDLYGRNEYSRVLDVIELSNQDHADVHALAFLKAKALFAENRFEEAVEALTELPENPQLKANHAIDLARLRRNAPEYVTLWEQEQQIREQEAKADDLPIVALETERGTIKIELFENHAPISVANFITLTEEGFYDDTTFHRVVANHVTQGGDPNTKPDGEGAIGQGGPGYRIPDEHNKPEARMHFAGSLGMAHGSAPNSAGSQFYIMHEPKPDLNGGYTVFGRVIEGLDVARDMKQGEKLIRAFVVRKGDHDYSDFEKLTGDQTPVPAVPQQPAPTQQPTAPAEEPDAEEPTAEEPAADEPASSEPEDE